MGYDPVFDSQMHTKTVICLEIWAFQRFLCLPYSIVIYSFPPASWCRLHRGHRTELQIQSFFIKKLMDASVLSILCHSYSPDKSCRIVRVAAFFLCLSEINIFCACST